VGAANYLIYMIAKVRDDPKLPGDSGGLYCQME
jgi:hypothetical protein